MNDNQQADSISRFGHKVNHVRIGDACHVISSLASVASRLATLPTKPLHAAFGRLDRAIDLFMPSGASRSEADALLAMGETCLAEGDLLSADGALRPAVSIFEELGDTKAAGRATALLEQVASWPS